MGKQEKNDQVKSTGRSGKPTNYPNRKSRRQSAKYGNPNSKPKESYANDPAWYTANGQILKDVASFNFNRPAGEPVSLGTWNSTELDPQVPGIMSIYTMPTVGISRSSIDPVNKATQKIYSFVRHANSGHSNYDPVDLMLYLMAMDSIYTYWAYLTRVYGTAMVFSKDNLYVGNALLESMGVKSAGSDSVRAHMAEFRAYINMFAVRASTWAVPNTMSFFVRHSWMYSNIYKDEDTTRAQMYQYVPAGLYQYALNSDTGAGKLTFKPLTTQYYAHAIAPFNNSRLKYQALIDYGDALLNAIEGVEDIGIMSGDILKAYGAENLWKLVQIPENYGVVPMYNAEVLAQIHNTQFVGNIPASKSGDNEFAYSMSSLDVEQDTDVGDGNLIFAPYFANIPQHTMNKLLDFWFQDVTPEMAMVASRNMVNARMGGSITGTTDVAYAVTSCGSELALIGQVWTYLNTGSLYQYKTYMNGWTAEQYLQNSKFNEAPHCALFSGDSTAYVGYFGELNNFAVLSTENVQLLNTAALLSMFNVANVG